MATNQAYIEVNDLLTAEFVKFQQDKTQQLFTEFNANIGAMDQRNVTQLAAAAFIQSSRAWLDKLQQTGIEALTNSQPTFAVSGVAQTETA